MQFPFAAITQLMPYVLNIYGAPKLQVITLNSKIEIASIRLLIALAAFSLVDHSL